MTTLAHVIQTYHTLKKWDRKMGHYMGADFLRKQDLNSLTYGFVLALRIVLAGGAASLLTVMCYAILSMGNLYLIEIALWGWGIGLWVISRSVYPRNAPVSVALLFDLGAVSVIGLGAGIYDIPAPVTFQSIMPSYMPVLLGVLCALEVFEAIARVLVMAFTETPEQVAAHKARNAERHAFRKVMQKQYFTPEEQRFKRWADIIGIAPSFPLIIIAILLSLSALNPFRFERMAASLIILLCPFLFMIPAAILEFRQYRIVLRRLQAAGLIERDEQLKVWRFKA